MTRPNLTNKWTLEGVRTPDTLYFNRHPYPEDIYWIIEVADNNIKKDLTKKRFLYAKFNIVEIEVKKLIGLE